MKVNFNAFEKFDKLYTRKQLFDRLTKYLVKSAVKSILKNKVLRIKAKRDEDSDDDEEDLRQLEKKKKLLLGY